MVTALMATITEWPFQRGPCASVRDSFHLSNDRTPRNVHRVTSTSAWLAGCGLHISWKRKDAEEDVMLCLAAEPSLGWQVNIQVDSPGQSRPFWASDFPFTIYKYLRRKHRGTKDRRTPRIWESTEGWWVRLKPSSWVWRCISVLECLSSLPSAPDSISSTTKIKRD